jgi:hypothetical protein
MRSAVPDGPHNDLWKSLIRYAYAVADEVTARLGKPFPIRIGGGSMLLRQYRHRKSRDLDLFVSDVMLVRYSSPRLNETAADLFPDYGEEAAAVKLIIGMQEIDIIAAAPIVLENATDPVELFGRDVLIERPREILAKKIAYRGRDFQPRDVFDLACVAAADPDEGSEILPWLTTEQLTALAARLAELKPQFARTLADKIEPYPEFEPRMGDCLDIATEIIEGWRRQIAAPGST